MTTAELMDEADAQRRRSRSRDWLNAYSMGVQHERERVGRLADCERHAEYNRGVLDGYRHRSLTFAAGCALGAFVCGFFF